MKIKPILMTVILSLMSFEIFATETKFDDSIEEIIKTYNVEKFEVKDPSKPIPPYLLDHQKNQSNLSNLLYQRKNLR